MTEKELVEKAQQGDNSAMNRLLERHKDRLYNVISSYVNNENDKEDILQEAMLRLYRKINKFDGESTFYTWAYRVTVNTCKNYFVSESKKIPYGSFEEMIDTIQPESNENPYEDLVGEALIEEIEYLISDLDDNLKRPFIECELYKKTRIEYAEEHGIGQQKVTSDIFRVRKILRDRYQELRQLHH